MTITRPRALLLPDTPIPAPTTEASGDERWRVAYCLLALAVASAALAAQLAGLPHLLAVAVVAYALFFFGGGFLALVPGCSFRDVALFGPGFGVGLLMLGGALMVHLAWVPEPAAWVIGGASAGAYLVALTRALRGLRIPAGTTAISLQANGDAPATRTSRLHASERLRTLRSVRSAACSIVGLAVCLVAAHFAKTAGPAEYGLLGSVPFYWYVGFALIVVGLVQSPRGRLWSTALSIVAILGAFDLTPVLSLPVALYPWTAKHVGVTAYILAHGTVHPSLDIYQAWPGFFAAMAWICRVAHIANPYSLAHYWQPIVDLLTLAGFGALASSFLRGRRLWWAIGIFICANDICQNYFSPQSICYALALVVFAAAFRIGSERKGDRVVAWSALVVGSFAIAVSHQLTPYMVFGALFVLVVFRVVRPWWLPLVPFVPAALWALLNLQQVRIAFNPAEFGAFFRNLRLRNASTGAVAAHTGPLLRIAFWATIASALIVGIVSLVSLLRSRQPRTTFALLFCAASGIGLLLVQQYGAEGSFRVLLFALPWLCIVVALTKARSSAVRAMITLALAVLPFTYLAAVWGASGANTVSASDLAMDNYYEQTAAPGSTMISLGYLQFFPVESTARYPFVAYAVYSRIGTAAEPHETLNEQIQTFTRNAVAANTYESNRLRVYAAVSPESETAGSLYGVYSDTQYRAFAAALARSPWWRVVFQSGGSTLLQLREAGVTMSSSAATSGAS